MKKKLAKLKYLPNNFQIIENGDYVECAVSGKKIYLENLTYWNVEFQEPYFSFKEAFKKRENSVWWDKYLTDKTARVIMTLDQPNWYYRWINGRPTYFSMKKLFLQFVGIQKVKLTTIGSLRLSTNEYREKWLQKVKALGMKNR